MFHGGDRLRGAFDCLGKFFSLAMIVAFVVCLPANVNAQGSDGHMVYGDFKVEGLDSGEMRPMSFDIILYTLGGRVVDRQTISNNGRYRFMNVGNGEYRISVETENSEVARLPIAVFSTTKTDIRQDITMQWRQTAPKGPKAAAIRVGYGKRTAITSPLFLKAEEAMAKKKNSEAITLFGQIVSADAQDYEAWTELATLHFVEKNLGEAEKAYTKALALKPDYYLASFNLGKLHIAQKNYDQAITSLNQALASDPKSAAANLYLGEAYLQIKKGSVAVGHFAQALRLDPVGYADAHLRLAALYNAAGLKDKAASEYEQFLVKKPNHPEHKKLRQYISDNKKASAAP
ncbi:MAG: tetratricopeptide repeat protein [Pyrinomonadaceae bacterium]